MDQGQTYRNHAQVVPIFHYVTLPILAINFLWTAWQFRNGLNSASVMSFLVALGLMLVALSARAMALKVQDRVIRLEMRLRLKEVLPTAMQSEIMRLTPDQLIGLRFASDAELPGLCREVLDGKLASRKAIKLKVQNWQGDYLRA